MVSANKVREHLWTDIVWEDRKRQYLFAGDCHELKADKLEAFCRPQGESILHILLQE